MIILYSSSSRVHLHLRSVPAQHAAVLAPTVSEDLPSETKHLQPGHAHVPLRDSGHLGTERAQPEVRLTRVYRYVLHRSQQEELDLPMKVNSLLPLRRHHSHQLLRCICAWSCVRVWRWRSEHG